ncbi:aldo/keto reductase [Pseudomonas aeruginosa]
MAHEETAGELERLRRDGKILAIGVSNYSPEQMDGFRQFAGGFLVRHQRVRPVDLVQVDAIGLQPSQ